MLPRKLPSELEEEILTRLPPLSLTRFKAVCKQWNALFHDKIFVNNHFACAQTRPEFLLQTDSKMYSVSVNLNDDDPNTKVRELSSFDITGLESYEYLNMVGCYGHVLLRDIHDRVAAWNPWLRQSRLVESEHKPLWICGIGYDGTSPQRSYKIVGYTIHNHIRRIVIYELATNAWKFIDPQFTANSKQEESIHYSVSLNGNLYWTAYDLQTRQCFIVILDCSTEVLKPFCMLPWKKEDASYKHVLGVFKGDRFSLLEQCYRTRKIEIWVTKKKITNGDDVVWIKFMSVSIPNVPILYYYRRYSSFLVDENIYGKSFVMCCRDESSEQACVYIVRGGMCRKIKADDVVGELLCCSVYVPSLMPIP